MIRVCPKRDAVCPHGMSCPYVIDRYDCAPEPRHTPDHRAGAPADAIPDQRAITLPPTPSDHPQHPSEVALDPYVMRALDPDRAFRL